MRIGWMPAALPVLVLPVLVLPVLLLAAACGDGGVTGMRNQPPVAAAGADAAVSPGIEVRFDGSQSRDPDGEIVRWAWDFGDGASAEGAVVTHAYAAEGRYAAKLTVFDDVGSSAADERVVTVSVAVVPNKPPVAVIRGQAQVTAGAELELSGAGSSDEDGEVVSWKWTFGDGARGDGVTVRHKWTAAGSYDVTLVVTDDDGDADTSDVFRVTVTEPPPLVPATSNWNWDKTESPPCGTFIPAPLVITISSGGEQRPIRISEQGGGLGGTTEYTGTFQLTPRSFSATHSSLGTTSTIAGVFDPDYRRFEGSYELKGGLLGCSFTIGIVGTRR